jgi:nucleoside-diphosphate-sugar epimerase
LVLPESPEKIHETTVSIWNSLSGKEIDSNPASTRPMVDVRDVARLHVYAIEHGDKANGERYLAVSGFTAAQAIADILNKHYPERKGIIQVGTPGKGYPADYKSGVPVDSTKAVKATGQDWIPYEKTVLDAAKVFEQFL